MTTLTQQAFKECQIFQMGSAIHDYRLIINTTYGTWLEAKDFSKENSEWEFVGSVTKVTDTSFEIIIGHMGFLFTQICLFTDCYINGHELFTQH